MWKDGVNAWKKPLYEYNNSSNLVGDFAKDPYGEYIGTLNSDGLYVVTTDANGTVHIANATDDIDYQATMTELLKKLKKTSPYSELDPSIVTSVFQDAQKKAIEVLQGNVYDCPYGTGNNSGRVEDTVREWGGKDNRKGDDSVIHMDQLVQITLYFFDKLLYSKLAE